MAKKRARTVSPKAQTKKKALRKTNQGTADSTKITAAKRRRATSIRGDVFKLIDWTQDAYYTSIASAIEHRLDCRIIVTSAVKKPIRGSGQARMWSRWVEMDVEWPEQHHLRVLEHWIFFDSDLDAELAAMVVAHELGHILLHLGRDEIERRKTDDEGNVMYTRHEECEADFFALCLMRHRRAFRKPNETWIALNKLVPLVKRYAQRVNASVPGLEAETVIALVKEELVNRPEG